MLPIHIVIDLKAKMDTSRKTKKITLKQDKAQNLRQQLRKTSKESPRSGRRLSRSFAIAVYFEVSNTSFPLAFDERIK